MATYCFKCLSCEATWENSSKKLGLHPLNGCQTPNVVRDYRAEAVGIETFTSVLGEGKVETRVVEPGDDITPRR